MAKIEVDPWAKSVKDSGQKVLVVVMPMTGNLVHKKFFISAMNVMSAGVINALANQGIQMTLHINPNFPIDYNRNSSVDHCLEKYLADYIFFMDTDQTFPKDSLLRMFETISEDTPVVTGMYYKKSSPFDCVTGRFVDWDEESLANKKHIEDQGFVTKDGKQCLYYKGITYFDKDVPFWVDCFGMGCVLAMADVFRNIERPYFKYTYDPRTGDGALLKNSEDMWFCASLKKAGIKALCEPRVQCGHITEIESNCELYENSRDSSFDTTKRLKPDLYQKIMERVLDVREEQKELREYLIARNKENANQEISSS